MLSWNVSSGPSNTSGPTMKSSTTWKKHASACFVTSKPFTIHSAYTKPSDTYHPTNSKPFTPRLLRRNLLPRRYPKVLSYRTTGRRYESRTHIACEKNDPPLKRQPKQMRTQALRANKHGRVALTLVSDE